MDLDTLVVALIDRFDEAGAYALIGLALGLAFGALARATGFCTRAMVAEWLSGDGAGRQRAVWPIAFAVTILSVQAMIAFDWLHVAETRFFGTAQSVSGAVLGGAIFGVGMALARGCASRLLVLGAGGNLRALATVAIIGLAAWATISGPLVPMRDALGGVLSTAQVGGNDLLFLAGLPRGAGVTIGLGLLVVAAVAAVRVRISPPLAIGAALLGLVVPAGWLALHTLSGQVFDPIQVESLSFVRPLSETAALVAEPSAWRDFDTAVIAGTLLGAFAFALLSGRLRIEGFGAPGAAHPVRYVVGGVLMGFGGVLAVGCTVGAGFTGGSVLALTGLLGLASMIGGAAATMSLLDPHPSRGRLAAHDAALQPAE